MSIIIFISILRLKILFFILPLSRFHCSFLTFCYLLFPRLLFSNCFQFKIFCIMCDISFISCDLAYLMVHHNSSRIICFSNDPYVFLRIFVLNSIAMSRLIEVQASLTINYHRLALAYFKFNTYL